MGITEEIKKLPCYEEVQRAIIESHREELGQFMDNIDRLSGSKLEFMAHYLVFRDSYKGVLLSDILHHLHKLVEYYDESFRVGFCDVGTNVRVAIGMIWEAE